jgi:hypothetical protein
MVGQEPERSTRWRKSWGPSWQARLGLRRQKRLITYANIKTGWITGLDHKRPGQYWSQQGDEALLCLETFWRNNRWHLLSLITAISTHLKTQMRPSLACHE